LFPLPSADEPAHERSLRGDEDDGDREHGDDRRDASSGLKMFSRPPPPTERVERRRRGENRRPTVIGSWCGSQDDGRKKLFQSETKAKKNTARGWVASGMAMRRNVCSCSRRRRAARKTRRD
jgi:hypothetical protein